MGLFGPKQNDFPYSVRVPLLEEKLSSYDEISKKMLERLEKAVEEISKSSQNISAILVRHEEKIERANEANSAVVQLINKVEEELTEKIDDNASDIDEIKKTRWVWFGIAVASAFFLNQFNVLDRLMTPHPSSPPPSPSVQRLL